MTRLGIATVTIVAFLYFTSLAQEKVFSGPQVGEKLKSFKVKGVVDDDAGKDLDFVAKADGKPILLIFIHDANRPSIGLTRALTRYAMTRTKDLVNGTIWLTDDATEAETRLKTISHALTKSAPIGVSPDGKEGPGIYGLNRNMILTILVGKDNKVTANFALVQPSLEADLPKILKEIVAVAGGEMPNYKEWPEFQAMAKQRPKAGKDDPMVPTLLRAVIQKTASDEEVDKAAAALEKYVTKSAAARAQVGHITKRIVDAGVVSKYGTDKAQEYLKKWAKEYGGDAPKERSKKDKR